MKFNRWLVVLGALLMQTSLGAIYIYSVFKPALKNHFPDWSATDLSLPAQILLAAGAITMSFAGKIQDKIGPKKTALAGAAILLLGMYVAAKADNLLQFAFGFGVLGGIGIYTVYVCPIATCVKWFPDKRGLITGLAVAGFGAGGLVFTPLATHFITKAGIMASLFYLGLIYFSAIVIGAQFLRVPPVNYRPVGYNPPAVQARFNGIIKIDYSAKEMVKTRRFLILWFTYFIGAAAGLMVIMNIVNIWQKNSIGNAAQVLAQGALAVMAVSIFNSLGRIAWGRISDKFGREKTLILLFSICAGALMTLANLKSFELFLAATSIIGFCFGGFLALYPAVCADYFGTKFAGANYGLMFTAYGAGGLLGPWLGATLNANLPTAIFCLVAAFLIYKFLK